MRLHRLEGLFDACEPTAAYPVAPVEAFAQQNISICIHYYKLGPMTPLLQLGQMLSHHPNVRVDFQTERYDHMRPDMVGYGLQSLFMAIQTNPVRELHIILKREAIRG